jgi:formylglycine-generating enzyme required for sulfatase activity
VSAVRMTACLLVFVLAFVVSLPAPETVRAQDGEKVITNSIGMKLTLIPAGKFLMGSSAGEEERDAEEMQHEVEITKPFYMGVYEVTQGQYEKIKEKNTAFFRQGQDFPMDQVRWPDAVDFCRKLSALPAEKKASRVYRLPTEAEWEYACRAGTKTVFHFGDALSSKEANFKGSFPYGDAAKGIFLQKTTKVGSYGPNAWGLYDMHGNVAEWCSDYYDPDYYKNSPKQDPKGPANGVLKTDFHNEFYRVVRGGCWLDEARACRAAYRFRLQATEPYRWVGFRVVYDVSK